MKLLDIVLLLLLTLGGYRGFNKGLVLELFSILALALAKVGSIKLVKRALAFFLGWYQGADTILNYILLTLLFFSIMAVVNLTGQLISYLIQPTLLGSVDRFLGMVVGVFKWATCISACLWLGEYWQLNIPASYTADTILFPHIKSLAPQLFAMWTSWWPGFYHWWIKLIPSLKDYMD